MSAPAPDLLTSLTRDVSASIERHRDCCCQQTLDTLAMLADLAMDAVTSGEATTVLAAQARDALEQAASVLGDES